MASAREQLLAQYRAALAGAAQTPPPTGTLIVLDRPNYRAPQTAPIVKALQAAGVSVVHRPHVDRFPDILRSVPGHPHQPAAVLRWEEHGELFNSATWQRTVRYLYGQGIVPLYVDYGYFGRPDHWLIDLYTPGGTRTIDEEWGNLSTADPWPAAPPALRRYRRSVLEARDRAVQQGPLVSEPYGVVWTQQTASLLRPPFASKAPADWIKRACEMLKRTGLKPVVKLSPVGSPAAPSGVQTFGRPREWNALDLNARLATFAKANIVQCSSVTNELVLLGAPVTALGRSWFNGLGVFHEPGSWDEPVATEGDVDHAARNRWCTWWIGRQCRTDDAAAALGRLVERGRTMMVPRAPARAEKRRVIFVTYHTDDAYYTEQIRPLVASLQAFGLEHVVYRQKNTGNWRRNCALKPQIIRRAMREHPGARVVFLDADATIRQRPMLFWEIDADFAAHWLFRRALGGTLMFDPTPAAHHLLDLWQEHLHGSHRSDQDPLGEAVFLAQRHGLRVANLPQEYVTLDKHMQVAEPVIHHRIAHKEGWHAVRQMGAAGPAVAHAAATDQRAPCAGCPHKLPDTGSRCCGHDYDWCDHFTFHQYRTMAEQGKACPHAPAEAVA